MTRITTGLIGFAASILFGLSTAHAGTNADAILKLPASSMQPAKSKSFVINEAMGRAWVEVDFYYALSETSDNYRVAVPGLRYDRELSQVVFESDGKQVVCATVANKGWGVFKQKHVLATGNCELSHRYVKKPVDNGFTIEHIEQFEVYFKPRMPSAT